MSAGLKRPMSTALAHRNAGRVVQSRPEIPSTYRGLVDPSRRRGIPNLARCRRAPSVRVDTLLLPASRYQPCSPPFHLSPACSRDSNWTHMHELPDLRPGALCYSHRVTREPRGERGGFWAPRDSARAPQIRASAFPFAFPSDTAAGRFGGILVSFTVCRRSV
jgi:hypothetical protein